MNDLDLMVTDEVRDLQCAQYAKRVPDRNVKNILRWQERETVLPIAGRPKCYEDLVSARFQTAGKIDEMALGPAVMSGG